MSEPEKRNLEVVKRWAETYNNDVERMVSECYAENCRVQAAFGGDAVEGRARFLELEQQVSKAAPRRKIRLEHTYAVGDVVVVEATLLDPDQGDDWRSPFCAILTFKDGQITADRTYLDHTKWPGFQPPR
jgi:ketosteroid isomerase-like protein